MGKFLKILVGVLAAVGGIATFLLIAILGGRVVSKSKVQTKDTAKTVDGNLSVEVKDEDAAKDKAHADSIQSALDNLR